MREDFLPITAFVVLPFRAAIAPLRTTFNYPTQSQPTRFDLFYSDLLTIDPPSHSINSKSWTQLLVETHFLRPKDVPEPDALWFMGNGNGVEIIDTVIIPQVNELLFRIRIAVGEGFGSEVLRSVGALDLVVANLQFRGKSVFARINATMSSTMGQEIHSGLGADLSATISHEWRTLARATDLVNHGYFSEGFVIAFALLDSLIQDFVTGLLQKRGLAENDAEELLRSIEKDRIRRYLDIILPLLGVRSPFHDTSIASDFKWFNKKRNKLMHAGEHCDLRDAQRGITAAFNILRALNLCGANFLLPSRLTFWSPL